MASLLYLTTMDLLLSMKFSVANIFVQLIIMVLNNILVGGNNGSDTADIIITNNCGQSVTITYYDINNNSVLKTISNGGSLTITYKKDIGVNIKSFGSAPEKT